MTIEELLNYLDGRGIVYTDEDLVIEALSALGLALVDDLEKAGRLLKGWKVRNNE